MRTKEFDITPEVRDRIRSLRNERNYTKKEIAEMINIPLSTYNNIDRKNGGTRSIDSITLSRLSGIFNCTQDYILCKTNDPNCDEYGKPVIIMNYEDIKLSDLSEVLCSDYPLLNNLHYLLCESPYSSRENAKSLINNICKIIKQI